MENDTIQILELFGGIGSPRCALRNLNIPTKAIDYVEINEKAVQSYNSMFREELAYKTQTVVGWNLKPDILIHGSPCQDMSIAGHQGKATGEGIVNILKAAVEEIYTGGLAKVTLNLRGGVKASISQNAKGEINVERTETKKQKLTE